MGTNDESGLSISGVDTVKGIAMTGGAMNLYLEVLAIFSKDAVDRLPLLKAVPDAGALTPFITQVHALKSASASLGAAEISAEAASMEAAAKAGDMAFIEANLGGFAARLSALVDSINAALERRKASSMTDNGGQAGDLPVFLSLLKDLKAALESEDDAGIDRIIEELKDKNRDPKTAETLEQISDQVLMSEFDSAIEAVCALLEGA